MPLIKNTSVNFMEHEFSVYRRYICLASYPNTEYCIGDITREFKNEDIVIGESEFRNTPVFRQLEWWEGRSYEELFSIRYFQVSEESNYYLVGDILEVDGFDINALTRSPKFLGYIVGNHSFKLDNCLPLKLYENYVYRNKPKINQK